MTEIRFIVNVPERLPYACKVARKSFMQERRLAIVAPMQQLHQLDQMLWSQLAPADFVAHGLKLQQDGAASRAHALVDENSILLLDAAALDPRPEYLLNLTDEVPAGFERYASVLELVPQYDEQAKQQARQRWRYYQQQGHAISSHDLMKGMPS